MKREIICKQKIRASGRDFCNNDGGLFRCRARDVYVSKCIPLYSNDDLRPAGKTNLPSVENERPTEMSRNKRPALNAAAFAYIVGMNYP